MRRQNKEDRETRESSDDMCKLHVEVFCLARVFAVVVSAEVTFNSRVVRCILDDTVAQ